MDFLKNIILKAKENIKTIVLPESEDDRILKAAGKIDQEKIAKVILIGDEAEIKNKSDELKIDLSNIKIINPETSEFLEEFVEKYAKIREKNNMTKEKAKKILLKQKINFAALLVDKGIADGMVAGAVYSTAKTILSIQQCIGPKEGIKTISSFFVMISPEKEFGDDGMLFFADCGVVPEPNDEQLAEIAESTADNYKFFTGKEPRVAFLSFSTKGSAATYKTKEVQYAYELLEEKRNDIICDGELQVDAAIIPSVCDKKAPDSKVKGRANVLIFPDLNSGNIGYKLVQRFGKATALGPIIQGSKKPANDLSRGCSVQDIINVVAITSIQTELQ
jgi:phosphate acetyltransferase